ncbi:MAG TPA: LuxR C-terminal-related transcriptional regulator [Dehalococcoidia bacterium]|nr:LuxR C-terminal-related transcriptional regulator [Dehalococcoidia bacterium]
MTSPKQTHEQESSHNPALQAGNEALSAADWPRAFELFRKAATQNPSSAEAWAGIATAAYWIPDEEAILEARERAFHLYCERGDTQEAAEMAAWLGVDWLELRGQEGLANGWMQRASRLITGRRTTREGVRVAQLSTRLLMLTGAPASKVKRRAARAATLARQMGMPEIEALMLASEGHARLNVGDVRNAIKCLDEAAAIILSSECTDLTSAALTLCSLMGACERTRDFDRARQWCAAARQFSEDRGFPVVLSICRPHYAAVLMWRGHWPEAEEHLRIGSRELTEFMPPFAVGALALMGSLRWKQGRWDEAEAIFEQIRLEPAAQVGIAELAASRGDDQTAIDIVERHLRTVAIDDKLERGPALEVLIRCLISSGDSGLASQHLAELKAIAGTVGSQSLRAAAAFAEGMLASATARWEDAEHLLGDAAGLYEREGAPFESARARTELAQTLCQRGRLDAAAREAQVADESFMRIGARREADRAGQLLDQINNRRKAATKDGAGVLTAREGEVLTLLAEGRSNQEIAESLVLSVRTVERHISNIYQKLGLEGRNARTAAAAHLHRVSAPPSVARSA